MECLIVFLDCGVSRVFVYLDCGVLRVSDCIA